MNTKQAEALQQAKKALIKGYKDGIYTPKQFAEALDALAALATVSSDASPSPVLVQPSSTRLNANESDPIALWAEVFRLRASIQGPDGYATWQDAATAERIRRVKAEQSLVAAQVAPVQEPVCKLEVVTYGTPVLVEGQANHALASIRGAALIAAGISITTGEWLFTDESGTSLDDNTPLADVKSTRIFLSRSAGIAASPAPDVRPVARENWKADALDWICDLEIGIAWNGFNVTLTKLDPESGKEVAFKASSSDGDGFTILLKALNKVIVSEGGKVISASPAPDVGEAQPVPPWQHHFDVPDALADKALSARVPGGSSVRDWFLPHESDKAATNVRDAMKCALLEVMQLTVKQVAPAVPDGLGKSPLPPPIFSQEHSDAMYRAGMIQAGKIPQPSAPSVSTDAQNLRRVLALVYCGPALYADDGELQDNRLHPFIDFKRDSADDILDKIHRRNVAAIAAQSKGAAPVQQEARQEQHYDDYAVDCFAQMMKKKLAKKRAEGRGGWNDPAQCSVEYLNRLLLDHVEKGDPVDVANFCMMLRHYGAKITTEPQKFDAWMANPYTKVLQKSVKGTDCLSGERLDAAIDAAIAAQAAGSGAK